MIFLFYPFTMPRPRHFCSGTREVPFEHEITRDENGFTFTQNIQMCLFDDEFDRDPLVILVPNIIFQAAWMYTISRIDPKTISIEERWPGSSSVRIYFITLRNVKNTSRLFQDIVMFVE